VNKFQNFQRPKPPPTLIQKKKRIKECNMMVFPFSQNFSCFLPYNISDISKKEEKKSHSEKEMFKKNIHTSTMILRHKL